MNAYALVRDGNIFLGVLTALLFMYMDRHAYRLLRQGLLSGGEFLGKVARVLFMLATSYSSLIAVLAAKPAGPYVVGLLVASLLLAAAAVWQTHDSWRNSKRRKAQP